MRERQRAYDVLIRRTCMHGDGAFEKRGIKPSRLQVQGARRQVLKGRSFGRRRAGDVAARSTMTTSGERERARDGGGAKGWYGRLTILRPRWDWRPCDVGKRISRTEFPGSDRAKGRSGVLNLGSFVAGVEPAPVDGPGQRSTSAVGH
ncbi:hypothetical protein AB1N83_014240 [Pleurotus pulmonarius]